MTNTRNTRIRNILLLICAMGCLVCYDIFGGLWLKGVTSAWFVALGLVNLGYGRRLAVRDRRFLKWVLAGLILGMCADVLLGIWFLVGVLAFALGHVMYLAAFCSLERPVRRDLWFMIPLCALSIYLVVGTPFIRVQDPMLEKLLLGYALIIGCMLGKAMSNLVRNRSLHRKLLFIGCLMFWFSDLMLAIDLFGEASRLTWILCSYSYWPAQNLLAHSMFHYTQDLKKT